MYSLIREFLHTYLFILLVFSLVGRIGRVDRVGPGLDGRFMKERHTTTAQHGAV